jgi:transposase-like protein
MKNQDYLQSINRLFPDNSSSLRFLSALRWGKEPRCPRCHSGRVTVTRSEGRYHCNICNRSFSATANTIFHNTRIPLKKWFAAVLLLAEEQSRISARALAQRIGVNKNTAWQMLSRLHSLLPQIRESREKTVHLISVHRVLLAELLRPVLQAKNKI